MTEPGQGMSGGNPASSEDFVPKRKSAGFLTDVLLSGATTAESTLGILFERVQGVRRETVMGTLNVIESWQNFQLILVGSMKDSTLWLSEMAEKGLTMAAQGSAEWLRLVRETAQGRENETP